MKGYRKYFGKKILWFIITLIVASMIKTRKKGKCPCCSHCSHCAMCEACSRKQGCS